VQAKACEGSLAGRSGTKGIGFVKQVGFKPRVKARVTTDEVPSTTRTHRPAGDETVAVAAVVSWNGSPHFYSVKPFTRYHRFCNRRITVIYGHDTTIWYDTISMLLS